MNCKACAAGNHSGCDGDVRLVAFMRNEPDPEVYCQCYKWDFAHTRSKQNGRVTPEELFDHQHALGISEWETKYDDREFLWEREREEASVPYEIGG